MVLKIAVLKVAVLAKHVVRMMQERVQPWPVACGHLMRILRTNRLSHSPPCRPPLPRHKAVREMAACPSCSNQLEGFAPATDNAPFLSSLGELMPKLDSVTTWHFGRHMAGRPLSKCHWWLTVPIDRSPSLQRLVPLPAACPFVQNDPFGMLPRLPQAII